MASTLWFFTNRHCKEVDLVSQRRGTWIPEAKSCKNHNGSMGGGGGVEKLDYLMTLYNIKSKTRNLVCPSEIPLS